MITSALDFSKSILAAMKYSYDEQGLISTVSPSGKPTPATIEGRRLVLPTPEWLRRGFGEDYIAFHPLCEAIARQGTSPVLQHMQRSAKAIIAHYFIYLAQNLLMVAADPGLQKDLPSDAKDFLTKVPDADKKLIPLFEKLVHAAIKKNRLLTVYLKNGGTYDGKKVNRMAVIRFPIMELLDGEDNNVLGVELRPKQRKTISNLLRTVMPFGDSPEEYSAGSNNRVAPYLHAFLQAYLKVARQFNRIVHRYAKPMALPINELPLYTEEDLRRMSEWVDEIPSLKGNEGGVELVEEEGAEPKPVEVQTQPTAIEVRPGVSTPTPTVTVSQPSAPASKGTGVSVREFLDSMRPQIQQPTIAQAPPPVMSGYGQMMGVAPDPRLPNWLVGSQPVQSQQVVSPFAHAVAGVHAVQVPSPSPVQVSGGYGSMGSQPVQVSGGYGSMGVNPVDTLL